MPCDNNYDGNSMCDFYDTLGCISSICESSGINSYIIGSDLNTDLSRVNSMHCMAIGEFVENNDLVLCYNTNLSTVDYTFESKINGSVSCVDHVIISHNMLDTLMSYDVLHSGCNPSDHSVILAAKFAIDFKRVAVICPPVICSPVFCPPVFCPPVFCPHGQLPPGHLPPGLLPPH